MPNLLAILALLASVVFTAVGGPAWGLMPLALMIACNGQDWHKESRK